MKILSQIFKGKGYVDGITIINSDGEILFSAKLNKKLSGADSALELVGKNFFEIYEGMSAENSTTIKAMELGMPVYVEHQALKAKNQKPIYITSLSIPIMNANRIVGAIDLSTQEGNDNEVPDESEKVELKTSGIPVSGNCKLHANSSASFTAKDIIAVDEKMKRAKSYISIVANCDLPVLIYGETGTGKEVFAQAIHNSSPRKNHPFIAQNCAAIPDTLLESILFGTAKGAFTDAIERKGLFELADGGTLFLDEINSMPLQLQAKLLRVLQDGTFRSLGSKKVKHVNVKIIAATNVPPLKAIAEGHLREDIYYRLSMMSIAIPPLRERRKDISYFVKYYISKYNEIFQKNVEYVSNDLIHAFELYEWPGNVRELEKMVVYGMSMVSTNCNMLCLKDVEDKFNESLRNDSDDLLQNESKCPEDNLRDKKDSNESPGEMKSLTEAVAVYERDMIVKAYRKAHGKLVQTAKDLGIPRQTLQRKIKKYKIAF